MSPSAWTPAILDGIGRREPDASIDTSSPSSWALVSSGAASVSVVPAKGATSVKPDTPVTVKTSVGTLTDGNGNYQVRVPAGSEVLVFSYLGYRTLERQVTGASMDVSLSREAIGLEGITVTALVYFTLPVIGEESVHIGADDATVGRHGAVRRAVLESCKGPRAIGTLGDTHMHFVAGERRAVGLSPNV